VRFTCEALDHVALVVSDVDRSTVWYRSVLGMERRFGDVWAGDGDPVVLCNGTACVALFVAADGEAVVADGRNRHFALRLDRENFAAARAAFAGQAIPYEFWDHRISRSLYVRDPDGYQVELTTHDL
jgi:catechol 2,3-dioxygenase-like lactoylglutathione lyase family enzyme